MHRIRRILLFVVFYCSVQSPTVVYRKTNIKLGEYLSDFAEYLYVYEASTSTSRLQPIVFPRYYIPDTPGPPNALEGQNSKARRTYCTTRLTTTMTTAFYYATHIHTA